MKHSRAIDRCRLRVDLRRPAGPARSVAGFTLTELMIAVVIIAILSSIAYPSYQNHVRKSRRAAAHTALMDAAARQEQFFLDNRTYADSVAADLNMSATTGGGHYAIVVDPEDVVNCPIGSCYVLRATPQDGQAADPCGALTLDADGEKGAAKAGCWD